MEIRTNRSFKINCAKKNRNISIVIYLLGFLIFIQLFTMSVMANEAAVKLGNEVLLEDYYHLIDGKKVGLVTNQTGVDSRGYKVDCPVCPRARS